MYIESFRKLYSDGKIKWSSHGLVRMQERDITIDDVANCILNGEIIEEYIEKPPAKDSVLIYGKTLSNKVIHIVLGIDSESIYFVTAYFPTLEKFEEDLKTRRK